MNDQTTTTGTASPLKRSVLKGKARASLLGHYMPLSSAFLSLAILQYIITAPSGLIQVHPPFGTILYYAVTFAISVFFGIFQVGITGLFLSNSCHQPDYAGGIFSGFWHEPLKAIQIQLVLSLLLCIPEIVPSLLFSLYLQSGRVNMVYLYAAAGISIVFLPFVLYVKTLYSQVFFIMLDFPELSAKECLKRSRRLMKGHKWQYFLLMVSFLPWLMGVFLTCGIGLLYVYPYQKQTYAYFYLELVSLKSAEAAGAKA